MPSQSQWKDLPRRLATICVGVPILWALWIYPFCLRLFWIGTHLVVACEWAILSEMQHWWLYPCLSLIAVQIPNTLGLIAVVLMSSAFSQVFLGESWTLALTRGFFLVSFPFYFWQRIGDNQLHGFHQTVSLLLTVWNCDTGALVIGRLFGGKFIRKPTKLQSISPNKSMEGLIGGLLFGLFTYATLPCIWTWLEMCNIPTKSASSYSNIRSIDDWAMDGLVGFMLSVTAVLGDLWESSLKRLYRVKDTSKLLPGHGKPLLLVIVNIAYKLRRWYT